MNIPLACSCGSLQGVAANISFSTSKRVVCMCDDCQAYAHFLKREKDILDANGGTEVYPVAPANLKITRGMEHLQCMRLTDKGMLRWYAGCCNTPIANSLPSPRIPFAGVVHLIMKFSEATGSRETVLGPIYARVQAKYGIGVLPADARQTASLKVIFSTVGFLLRGWFKRQHTPSPFFDATTGKPVVEPYVLASAERENLRPAALPT